MGSAFVDNGIPTYVIGIDIRDEIDDMTGRNVHDECEDGDGWRWVSTAAPFSTIELCGETCDAFASAGKLETHYACLPVG